MNRNFASFSFDPIWQTRLHWADKVVASLDDGAWDVADLVHLVQQLSVIVEEAAVDEVVAAIGSEGKDYHASDSATNHKTVADKHVNDPSYRYSQ